MIVRELRQATRSLRKSPGFSLVVIATLAVALGATLTMFSLVDATLLQPLPFASPARLVALWDSTPGEGHAKVRVAGFNFLRWRTRARAFDAMAAYKPVSYSLIGIGDPLQLVGSAVTEDFFPLLGVKPLLGRTFLPQDLQPAAPPAVVLSHTLWRNRLGGDPAIVGRTLSFDGHPYTVIGVLPRQILPQGVLPAGRIDLGSADDHFWIPLPLVPPNHNHLFGVLARLRPDVTLEQARAEMAGVAQGLGREFPATNREVGVEVVPLTEEAVGNVRASLWILFGAVGLLQLLAYANLINLLLVRADARARELAVRAALGAGSMRVLRNLVTEGLILAAAGTAGGALLCFWALRLLPAVSPHDVPRLDEAALGPGGLLVALLLCLVSAAVFTLVPALRVPRGGELPPALRGAGTGGATVGNRRFRRLLAAAEMALAVTLVIGSTLLVESLRRLQAVDPGFTARRILSLELQHRPARYAHLQDLTGFYEELFRRVGVLPGVVSVAAAYDPPLTSNWYQIFSIENAPEPPEGKERGALFRTVTPGYFAALGVPVVGGRPFNDGDDMHGPGAAIVNQAFLRAFFSGQSPLGRRLVIANVEPAWGGAVPSLYTIVGVVGDEKLSGLTADAEPAFYLPFRQAAHRRVTLLVSTAGEPLALATLVRQRLRALDPELPIVHTSTLNEIVGRAVAQPRFDAWVLGAFSTCSLLLAMVGLWGVLSLNARQRTHEIGIRMAIGANRTSVFGLMIRDGLVPVLAGIAAGVLGALALSRFVRRLLYGVSPTDPWTYALVPAALLVVALVACCLPARRASATDPMQVLHAD